MTYNIAKIENTVIDDCEPIEICLTDGIFRSVTFSQNVQQITVSGGKARSGFIFLSEDPVTVVLQDCKLGGMLGQPAIKKEKGELKLIVTGGNELCGCDASFGPSSYGESPAIVAQKLTVCFAENAILSLKGGRTFASLFKVETQYVSPIKCNEIFIDRK